MKHVAISVDKLTCRFGDKQAVAGISFNVEEGEIFGLLGPNGAGKSTTISMLTGLIKPSSGKISVLGKDFSTAGNTIKSVLGVVPQSLALYPTLTALDNVAFFGRIYGLRGATLKKRSQEVLEIVGLFDRATDVVDNYSGGMKRRLNLAIALIHQPKILFLDEPTVGVDPQSRNAIFEAIKELNKSNMTILYTTHYMEEAERLCNRIAIMDMGKIIALDTPQALCRSMGEGFFQVNLANEHEGALLTKSLNNVPVIRNIRITNSVLEVEAESLQQALMSFMKAAIELGIGLLSLKIFESNLETVFLKLTGKKIRDE